MEPGSLIRFIEETFGLPSLGAEDATSNSADDMFDFNQSPQAFTTIVSARYGRAHLLAHRPSGHVLDDDMLGPFGPTRL